MLETNDSVRWDRDKFIWHRRGWACNDSHSKARRWERDDTGLHERKGCGEDDIYRYQRDATPECVTSGAYPSCHKMKGGAHYIIKDKRLQFFVFFKEPNKTLHSYCHFLFEKQIYVEDKLLDELSIYFVPKEPGVSWEKQGLRQEYGHGDIGKWSWATFNVTRRGHCRLTGPYQRAMGKGRVRGAEE